MTPLSVDDMLRLTEGMAAQGVVAFEAGDLKVSFAYQSPSVPALDPLAEVGDEVDDEDMFYSSPIRKRSV